MTVFAAENVEVFAHYAIAAGHTGVRPLARR
jgi:hypothetical protein